MVTRVNSYNGTSVEAQLHVSCSSSDVRSWCKLSQLAGHSGGYGHPQGSIWLVGERRGEGNKLVYESSGREDRFYIYTFFGQGKYNFTNWCTYTKATSLFQPKKRRENIFMKAATACFINKWFFFQLPPQNFIKFLNKKLIASYQKEAKIHS